MKTTAQIEWQFPPELPDDNVEVLIAMKDGRIMIGAIDDSEMWWQSPLDVDNYIGGNENVFAWAHLPKPPGSLTA